MQKILDRAVGALEAQPKGHVRQRMREFAMSMSNAGAASARVEVANAALCGVLALAYHADGGTLPNLDPLTGRLLKPMPWGTNGWRAWGLRRWEADVFRHILLERQRMREARRGQLGPLIYSWEERYWLVDTEAYPTLEAACVWLQRNEITDSEWRAAAQVLRTANAQRQRERARRLHKG